jgi:hypothetical protein
VQPLVVRLVDRLPGPFWAWAIGWAVLVPLRPLTNGLVLLNLGDTAGANDLFARALSAHLVLGLIVAIALFGSRLLWRRAQAAEEAVLKLSAGSTPTSPTFTGLDSTVGPLAVAAAFVLVSEASNLTRYPLLLSVVDAPLLAFVALPIAGFVWAYAAVLVAVDRLGRRALDLDPFPEDRSLGLRPVGSLVFTGFALLSVAVVLYLLFLGHFLTDLVMGAVVFVVGVVLFVLSLWRLHGQMLRAKRRYVEGSRQLYGEAYLPLRRSPTLATLAGQASLLGAAEALEKRAEAIQEWPVDDRTVARLAVIVTGVLTGLILRAILDLDSILELLRR